MRRWEPGEKMGMSHFSLARFGPLEKTSGISHFSRLSFGAREKENQGFRNFRSLRWEPGRKIRDLALFSCVVGSPEYKSGIRSCRWGHARRRGGRNKSRRSRINFTR